MKLAIEYTLLTLSLSLLFGECSQKQPAETGPQWAEAGASRFKYFKGYTTQGGISAPMIISGPGVRKKGEVVHAFTTLMDLDPTFYEYAGVNYPEVYLDLLNEWHAYRDEVKVRIPAPQPGEGL